MEELSVFDQYKVLSIYKDLKHPSKINETKTLASIPMKPPKYQHSIPTELLDSEEESPPLSGVQMDAILYAGEAFTKMLEFTGQGTKPARKAFLIGDGAGVGKGRTLAAIILDNYFQGRLKSVWVSCSRLLAKDAERDLNDLTKCLRNRKLPEIQVLPQALGPIDFKEGVLFATYATIGRRVKAVTQPSDASKNIFKSRIDQIVHWLGGENFDGVVIFDEAHKAKGFKDEVKKNEKISNIGEAVFKLQTLLPNARIVYVSATIATDIRDMEFMYRLGLWGTTSTAFPDAKVFFEFVKHRGIGGCEVVACEMKHRRVYLSRHLAFGETEFNLKKCNSEPSMNELYNKCTELWALLISETPSKEKNMQSQLWATSQKFFKALCIASKLPDVIKLVHEKLIEGKCVVIGIQSTGEAAYSFFRRSKYHNETEVFSPCRMYLENYILTVLKIVSPAELGLSVKSGQGAKVDAKQKSKSQRDNGSDSSSSSSDPDSDIFLDSESSESSDEEVPTKKKKMPPSTNKPNLKQRNTNIDRICKLFSEICDKLPPNPVDVIQAEFGYDSVAELTGRKVFQKLKIVRSQIGKTFASDGVRFIKAGRLNEVHKSFQEWTTEAAPRIAVISEAASTGISLHSSRKSNNKLQRVHIILEAPWTATQTCQQIGRTHRANQVHLAQYFIMMSDVPGETRFATALAGRMESLGALCKGDRKSSHGSLWQEYELDAKVAKEAIRDVINCILGNESNLSLFENSKRKESQRKLQEMLRAMNLSRESKKGEELPNAPMTNYEKFLNRILCCNLQTQEEVLNYLDLAVGNSQQNDMGTIRSLSEHIYDAPFMETSRHLYQVSDDISCSIIQFSKSDLLQWTELIHILHNTEKKDVVCFTKSCESKNNKVCVGVKKSEGTSFFEVYRPCTRTSKNKTYRRMSKAKYTETKLVSIEEDWICATSFFLAGNCTKKFSKGECSDKPCNHRQPNSKFAVVSGGILKLWDDLETLLDNPITFVRHTDEKGQLLGIFIPQDKIEQVFRCVENHFGKEIAHNNT